MLDLFCLLLIQFIQSINQKKERKKVQQTNQPTIYFIVICSFISIQFNSRKEKKRLKQTIKRTITKHQSFLIHLTNLIINQSIIKMNEREMKWDLSNFSFPTNPSSNCLNCNFTTQPNLKSINQWNWKKEWFWFGFVSFQLGIDFHSQSNLIPISNQSSQRDEREKWIEREREKRINNQVCFLHSSINQSIQSNQVKWNESIFIHSFYSFEVKVISMMMIMMCNWSESESIRPSLILLLLIHWSHSFITNLPFPIKPTSMWN